MTTAREAFEQAARIADDHECGGADDIICNHQNCAMLIAAAIRREALALPADAPGGWRLDIEKLRQACIQARGALLLDAMVQEDGTPFGTTQVALEAIAEALGEDPATPQSEGTP